MRPQIRRQDRHSYRRVGRLPTQRLEVATAPDLLAERGTLAEVLLGDDGLAEVGHVVECQRPVRDDVQSGTPFESRIEVANGTLRISDLETGSGEVEVRLVASRRLACRVFEPADGVDQMVVPMQKDAEMEAVPRRPNASPAAVSRPSASAMRASRSSGDRSRFGSFRFVSRVRVRKIPCRIDS